MCGGGERIVIVMVNGDLVQGRGGFLFALLSRYLGISGHLIPT